MAQIGFYATAEDLLQIFEAIEQKEPIRYVEMGHRSSASFPEYSSVRLIPSFGVTDAEQMSGMVRYLILDKDVSVSVEQAPNRNPPRYRIYEVINPTGVELTPGGVFESGVLLAGRLATMELTDRAKELYRLVAARVKKNFKRVGAFYVGPAAYQGLEHGWRLTAATQSPTIFDLTLSDQVH